MVTGRDIVRYLPEVGGIGYFVGCHSDINDGLPSGSHKSEFVPFVQHRELALSFQVLFLLFASGVGVFASPKGLTVRIGVAEHQELSALTLGFGS